jgi:hypothetical protein
MRVKTGFVMALMSAVLASSPAFAFDTYSGKITAIQTIDSVMHFRVILDTPMTNCNLNFAFVETSSSAYNTFVSELTTAYITSKTVTLQVTRETSGFCRINFMQY